MNQSHGKLATWKSDRGFGFIRPEGGGKDVFVHIKDFGTISREPKVGDIIRYSPIKDASGKLRAADVHIDGVPRVRAHAGKTKAGKPGKQSFAGLGAALGVALLAGFLIYAAVQPVYRAAPSRAPETPQARSASEKEFICMDKHYCSQMRSCAEAKFYLRSCPDTKMDGDGDGIPCEKQLCRPTPLGK
jgi:cold shock CspA family protein